MFRRHLVWLAAIFGVALFACGDEGGTEGGEGGTAGWAGSPGTGGSGGSGGSGGTGGTGGNGDKEPAVRDTSGYEGYLSWSRGVRFGVFVWDLAKSEMRYEKLTDKLDEEDASGEFYGHPSVSTDGSTLVYQVEHSFFLTARRAHVMAHDFETGAETKYPEDDLGEDWVRNTILPSVSADGNRIAVAETHAQLEDMGGEMLPGEGTPLSIEVWDRAAGSRIRVTDGGSTDSFPMLSADGTRVLFLSDRAEKRYDLYVAAVEENAEVEQVSLWNHPEITKVDVTQLPGLIAASADLRWVVFLASIKEGSAPFLLDTTTGEIERIGMPVAEASGGETPMIIWNSIAISLDGSRLAASLQVLREESMSSLVVTAPRAHPDQMTVVAEEQHGLSNVALSADGKQVAFMQLVTLFVDKAEGGDPRIVAGEPEGTVMSMGARVSF